MDRGDQLRRKSTWVRKTLSFWPYAIAGAISWYGFMRSGLHPALGLLPIVPAIPHADRAFESLTAEEHLHDLLNTMEHALKHPVEIVLFFFGLCNAGVKFEAIGDATWLVLLGLIVGKPIGIYIFGWLAAVPLRLGMPEGMRLVDLIVIAWLLRLVLPFPCLWPLSHSKRDPCRMPPKWVHSLVLVQRCFRLSQEKCSEFRKKNCRNRYRFEIKPSHLAGLNFSHVALTRKYWSFAPHLVRILTKRLTVR